MKKWRVFSFLGATVDREVEADSAQEAIEIVKSRENKVSLCPTCSDKLESFEIVDCKAVLVDEGASVGS
jgi:hypothetical protein